VGRRRPASAAIAIAALLAACAAPATNAPQPLPPPLPALPGAPADLLVALRARPVVDLTHPLDDKTPYWPGQKYFPFEAWETARFEEVRAFSRAYRVPEHYGTHLDAPNHFSPGQASIEQLPPDRLFGPAVVFDISVRAARDHDAVLTAEDVLAWEADHGRVPEGAIALLRTGWAARWGDAAAYRNFDGAGVLRFPSYGLDAARLLLVERGCIGLGVDALSVDRGVDPEFPVHRLGSAIGRWFAENLANLERLPPAGAVVIALPVPLRGGSGAQARVLAFLPPPR
jgi:kynurenine formamidase